MQTENMKQIIPEPSADFEEIISEVASDFKELQEIERLLRLERNNYKVRLRIQMKKEHKSIEDLVEEWEEFHQATIIREMTLKTKYEKKCQSLSVPERTAIQNSQIYLFELIFIVLKQYGKEILEALDELKCQTKN